MKLSKVLAAVAALAVMAHVAGAQVAPGMPFYPTATGLGVTASADYANPDWSGTTTALTGGAGFGPFGASVTVGRHGESDKFTTYGATVAMKLFGGGLTPITIGVQAGATRFDNGVDVVTIVPVGVVARASLPLFPIKPWVVGYYRKAQNGPADEVRVTLGASFNFLFGLGVHAAYDYGDSGNSWGVGAHFNFRLPVPIP